jgi:4-hydroxy-3-methylbut-2-enyl diphosphate reductase
MAKRCDLVIVVGSPNSSNSNRLREVAAKLGVEAQMIDRAEELQAVWLEGKRCVGVTAGASAPDVLVRQVIERLRALGASDVAELDGVVEKTVFPMPKGLAARATTALL